MNQPYTAHVTKRNGVSVRVDISAALSPLHASLQAMLQVGEASRSAMARPVTKHVKTIDLCGFHALSDVADSNFGGL